MKKIILAALLSTAISTTFGATTSAATINALKDQLVCAEKESSTEKYGAICTELEAAMASINEESVLKDLLVFFSARVAFAHRSLTGLKDLPEAGHFLVIGTYTTFLIKSIKLATMVACKVPSTSLSEWECWHQELIKKCNAHLTNAFLCSCCLQSLTKIVQAEPALAAYVSWETVTTLPVRQPGAAELLALKPVAGK